MRRRRVVKRTDTKTTKKKGVVRDASRVTAHKPNLERIRKQMRRIKSRRTQIWKAEAGKNLIRILPPWGKSGTWFKEVLTHYVNDAEDNTKAIGCPTIVGGRCALCETRAKLSESRSAVKQKQADEYKPNLSYYVNMVDLKDKESGVQIGRITEKTTNDLLEYFTDTSDWGDFTDPRAGFNIILHREGQGLQTRYSIKLQRKETRIAKGSWLKELNDLDKKFPVASYGETRAFLRDGEDDEEDYEDDDYEDDEEEYDE